MIRRAFSLTALISFAAILVLPARAQQNDPAAQNPPPSAAQNPAQDAASPAKVSPQKKIWTNDDVNSLRANGGTPPPQAAAANPEKSTAQHPAPAGAKSANWYQDQIAKLQEKLPSLDEQMAKLQAALDGKTVDETRHFGVRIDDWRDELARLQKKRADITGRIAALQDEARHKGVPLAP